MKKDKLDKALLYIMSLAVIVLTGLAVKNLLGTPKIVYVDISKIINGYKFKKELEGESSKNLYQIKNAVDSLKIAKKFDVNPIIDSQIMYAERAFDQYYNYSNQEMTKKIWERLNPQLEEFGKKYNYELIVGANGAGNVLYGDKKNDVTENAIAFINGKYEKGN